MTEEKTAEQIEEEANAPEQTTALAVPESLDDIGDQFMPGMDQGDFVPPILTLVQGQSKAATDDGIAQGKYYCAQSGEQWEKVTLILLRVARTRVLFTPDELAAPICQSDDRINPRPGGKYHGLFTCENCPARVDAPWLLQPEQRAQRERDPGLCPPGYTFLAADHETGMPFVLRVNGTSVSPWKTVLTTFSMKYKNVPFAAPVELTSRTRSDNAGHSFFIMTPSVGGPLEMERVQEYFSMAQRLQGVDLSAFEEEKSATEKWIGEITEDPNLKYTPDGNPVLDLNMEIEGLGTVWVQGQDNIATEMALLNKGLTLEMTVRPGDEETPPRVVSFDVRRSHSSTKASRDQLRRMMALVGENNMTPEDGKKRLTQAFPGVEATPDLTEEQADDFIAMLDGKKPWPEQAEGEVISF